MDTNIQKTLKDEYGIQVYREDISIEELKRRGYRKATQDEISYFDAILQYAPQIAKDRYYADAVQKSFESAVEGSYRMLIEPGLHPGTSHTTPDAIKGLAFDESNHLKGQVDWLKNNSKLTVSNLPLFASQIFNAVSFVTGQYFMTCINRNLSDIKADTTEIKQFLENARDGQIEALISRLNEISSRYHFIVKNERETERKIDQLERIQDTAVSLMRHSINFINEVEKEANEKDKKEKVKGNLNKVANALMEYRLLAWVYCQSGLLALILKNTDDVDDIRIYRDTMECYISDYLSMYDQSVDWMFDYVSTNRSVTDVNHLGSVAIGAIGAGAVLLGGPVGVILGLDLGKETIKLMLDDRKSRINEHVDYTKRLIRSISEYHEEIKLPVQRLSQYIDVRENGMEVVKAGDEYYTNLPG